VNENSQPSEALYRINGTNNTIAQNQQVRNYIINKLDSIVLLQDFATREGLIDDLEATERWFKDNYEEPSTEAVIGVGIVFDGVFGGASLNLALPMMPSFFCMNKRTPSFSIVGSKVFCDRTWYRGQRWWRWWTPNACIILVGTNEDNRYESAI